MLLATATRIYCLDTNAEPGREPLELAARGAAHVVEGSRFAAAALRDGTILVWDGTEQPRGIDTGIEEPITSLLILSGAEGRHLLAGTEGAHVWRIGYERAERIRTFDELDCRTSWHTPWGGPPAVRSLAATPDGWVYADIHVGSIMRSPDRGRSWEPVAPELNEDVHQVATCPAAPARVYANTARGVYVSDDRGASWNHRAADLDDRYGRAIAVAPDDPELLLATVSDGPHGDDVRAGMFRSDDAGRTWRQVTDGFPASSPENINTHRVAFSADGTGWAAVGHALYIGRDRATTWHALCELPERIEMISTAG
ncbi:MAG: WD40/YVTN/BNR-like repeat-containing protein [Planctomycetota bacterium]